QDWGVNDVWNEIIYKRFERLNELTNSSESTTKDLFGSWTNKEGKNVFQTQVPIELSKGFNKKRIDHRHHAMDAIVIACATRSHVNYLNNESGKDNESGQSLREAYKHKLCFKTKPDAQGNYKWVFNKPWETFTQDARSTLNGIIVGIKQNLRVINKTINHTSCYDEDASKKIGQKQITTNWAIRKSMHKATVFGEVNLRMKKFVKPSEAIEKRQTIVDSALRNQILKMVLQGQDTPTVVKNLKKQGVLKVEVYYFTSDNAATRMGASRTCIDMNFDAGKISKISDSGIQKILLAHLEKCESNPKIAFSADGLAKMNAEIETLNGGKKHCPIYHARMCEPIVNKFQVGERGNKSKKFVEADHGTNLFFAIYVDTVGKRSFDTIPLNVVIERQKQGVSSAPDAKGNALLYVLSPNDLVYLPTQEQLGRSISIDDVDQDRIYKFVSCTGTEGFFMPANIASPIVTTIELGSNNKAQKSWSGEMIKEICLPLKVDRLGNILKILQ
ncbi:MAG: type II CRISPR RNA-guided endonuclease Cas9, partial [Alistipes sp.]